MNKLLSRQLHKLYPTLNFDPANLDKTLDSLSKDIRQLLITVSDTYDGFDQDRALAERSIELSSEELLELNRKVREESERQQAILNDLRAATAVLRPHDAKNSSYKWLTTKDEAVYLANSLSKLIEEEKRNEKELEETKNRAEEEKSKAEAILQSIGDGVFAVDLERNIMLMNPIAEFLAKVSFASAVGKNYKDIFKFAKENESNLQDNYPDFIESTIKEGVIKKLENHTILIRQDNTSIPILDSAAPIKDKNGKILGGIVVIRDASRERALEQAKDDFISIAAHQLRTPLGSMRWTLELLLRNPNLDESVKTKADSIYKSNLRIINLVNDLLDVSRIDQGRVQDAPEATNIFDIIRAAVSELEAEAQQKKVAIDLQLIQDSIPLINLDPKRFREVIENLLSNAIKYSLPGGSITITTSPKKDRVNISIADQGMGIPEVDQTRVFTKFYRAQNAARSETAGSGLGLFVVKSYVEAWGGKVSFESVEGRGTTFHIEIPYEIKYTAKEELPATHAEGVAQVRAQETGDREQRKQISP